MSLYLYPKLPRFIRVRVSPERFVIAQLETHRDTGDHPPFYDAITKPLKMSQAAQALDGFQRMPKSEDAVSTND